MLDPPTQLRSARQRAGLSQRRLARLAGTSQPTVAAYEAGRKAPSVATFIRLLAHCGERVTTTRAAHVPIRAQLAEADRRLQQVLEMAEALPFSPTEKLRFRRLPVPGPVVCGPLEPTVQSSGQEATVSVVW